MVMDPTRNGEIVLRARAQCKSTAHRQTTVPACYNSVVDFIVAADFLLMQKLDRVCKIRVEVITDWQGR